MSNLFKEAGRNALVMVFSVIFTIIILTIIIYVLFKYVLIKVDWGALIANKIKEVLFE